MVQDRVPRSDALKEAKSPWRRSTSCSSILHFEYRTLLRPALPAIIRPRGRNVGMPQPLLHLGNVCVVRQSIGVGDLGSLHTLNRIVHHGIALTEVLKERRDRREGTGSVEWEWLLILKQLLIQTPVQFSRDPYVVEMPGRMGICMPYVVYPLNSSRVLVRALFYIQIA